MTAAYFGSCVSRVRAADRRYLDCKLLEGHTRQGAFLLPGIKVVVSSALLMQSEPRQFSTVAGGFCRCKI